MGKAADFLKRRHGFLQQESIFSFPALRSSLSHPLPRTFFPLNRWLRENPPYGCVIFSKINSQAIPFCVS